MSGLSPFLGLPSLSLHNMGDEGSIIGKCHYTINTSSREDADKNSNGNSNQERSSYHVLNLRSVPRLWQELYFYLFIFKDFIYLFLERGERREKERERDINVWLLLVWPLLGTWPASQACALTGNWTDDPLVHRLVLNPLSHSSQGNFYYIISLTKQPSDADITIFPFNR